MTLLCLSFKIVHDKLDINNGKPITGEGVIDSTFVANLSNDVDLQEDVF